MEVETLNRKILKSIRGTLRKIWDRDFKLDKEHFSSFELRLKEFIEKQLIQTPDQRDFRLRLSGMGKDLISLQCAKLGLDRDSRDESFTPIKFMFGDMIEALILTLIESSGIVIDIEQENVKLDLGDDIVISGTLDLVIDGKVYDIKTASPFSFEKFKKGLSAVEAQDSFGYCSQLAAYSHAGGYEVGGWIVINKVTGEIVIVDCSELDVQYYLEEIKTKAIIVNSTNSIKDINSNIPYFIKEGTEEKYLDKSFYFFSYKQALGWKTKLKWRHSERNWFLV